tara:strand:- start:31 stop:405 length:375 start_codon:yes stop_codon:yes gene_type:complete
LLKAIANTSARLDVVEKLMSPTQCVDSMFRGHRDSNFLFGTILMKEFNCPGFEAVLESETKRTVEVFDEKDVVVNPNRNSGFPSQHDLLRRVWCAGCHQKNTDLGFNASSGLAEVIHPIFTGTS